ncbi:MAG: helix-hairpin-helix domain-containing protein [Clostridium sp.]|nr:helix-hairpin-helix domain-containing protein [Clostridium sp.]
MKSPGRHRADYPKSDRRALIIIFVLLWLSGICTLYLHYSEQNGMPELTPEEQQEFARMYKLLTTDTTSRRFRKNRTYYAVPIQNPETFPFDPNTADSTTLLRLGLQPWQVRNIYTYRARGGRYHRPEDFSRLYGLTNETYDRLRPMIRIDRKYQPVSRTPDTLRLDTTDVPRITKYTTGTWVDLNLADTTELQRIPGIGRVRAALIVRHRNRLGGYVNVAQLGEIEGMPDSVQTWFRINEREVRQMNLNHLSIDRLRNHPYLSFRQCRVIIDHRRKFGRITSLQELANYDEFTSEALERLAPYVCF